tara:strand:+ start:25 stop:693 length:669 start_codon:yes stop_codon:yes gene_type:complete
MLKLFFNILFFSTLIISNDNLVLLQSLENNEDWSLIDMRKDSIRVYEKKVEGMDLSALKVEKIIDFNPKLIFETIMDINNYPYIMENPDVTSFIIGQRDNMIYAYNHFPIPLPFIEDRHYIFKIKQVSDTQINWHLVDYMEVKSSPRLKSITDKNSSAVYMDYGAGLWEIEILTESLSRASYILYMDAGGSLTNNLNDLFASQSIIDLYQSILKESNKKAKK